MAHPTTATHCREWPASCHTNDRGLTRAALNACQQGRRTTEGRQCSTNTERCSQHPRRQTSSSRVATHRALLLVCGQLPASLLALLHLSAHRFQRRLGLLCPSLVCGCLSLRVRLAGPVAGAQWHERARVPAPVRVHVRVPVCVCACLHLCYILCSARAFAWGARASSCVCACSCVCGCVPLRVWIRYMCAAFRRRGQEWQPSGRTGGAEIRRREQAAVSKLGPAAVHGRRKGRQGWDCQSVSHRLDFLQLLLQPYGTCVCPCLPPGS